MSTNNTGESQNAQMVEELENLVLSQVIFSSRFDVAKTRYTLTQPVEEAREAWNKSRDDFASKYEDVLLANRTVWKCDNQEAIVSSSILPAKYATGTSTTSHRSKCNEHRSNRYYPPTIEKWTEFPVLIDVKFDTSKLPRPVFAPLFRSIMSETTLTNESAEQSFLNEFVFAPFSRAGLMCLPFQVESNRDKLHRDPIIGKPDETCYLKPEEGDDRQSTAKKTAVFEAKALHNMLLPNDFDTLKHDYEGAVRNQMTKKKARSKNWSQICHPLAQELAYMVDNGVRYGALFCASKAYFIHLSGSERKIDNVKMTDAYIAGQKNFLRAWACVLRLANSCPAPNKDSEIESHSLELPTGRGIGWLLGTPIDVDEMPVTGNEEQVQPGRDPSDDDSSGDVGGSDHGHFGDSDDSKRSGGSSPPTKRKRGDRSPRRSSKQQGAQYASLRSPPRLILSRSAESEKGNTTSLLLTPPTSPFELFDFEVGFVQAIDFRELKIGQLLGVGKNGDVFASNFDGEEVAVKQFDLSKNFESYENEVKAYMHLEGAWGELVPTPKFIAQSPSGMVRFLGLQKGRIPDGDVDGKFNILIRTLKTEYHFQPLDYSHGRNCILVDGDNEQEKLLIIDLELWEHVGKQE